LTVNFSRLVSGDVALEKRTEMTEDEKKLGRLARFAARSGCSPEKAYDLINQIPEAIGNFAPYLDDYGNARRAEEDARRAGEAQCAEIERARSEDILKRINEKLGIYSLCS
jgi:hypothetical protein